MKNVCSITVLSLGYILSIHVAALAGDYTRVDLIGFSKDGDYVAYQLSHDDSTPSIFQEKIIILDVNNQKIIKVLTRDDIPVYAPASQSRDEKVIQAGDQAEAQKGFNVLRTIDLEKYHIIEWNKGIQVYRANAEGTDVFPPLSKEVSFGIKDKNNQMQSYKVVLQPSKAYTSDCGPDLSTGSLQLFSCKIINTSWEAGLAIPFLSDLSDEKEQAKELLRGGNCFRDYCIQSIYIYRDKIIVFVFAGASTAAVTGKVDMNWSVVTVMGTMDRAYEVIPDAPVITGVQPPAQFNFPAQPVVSRDMKTNPLTPVARPAGLLPAPSLQTISPNPDYDGNVYLAWEEVPGAVAYKIYRELLPVTDTSLLTPLALTTDWYYLDSSPKKKNIYWYAVTAVSAPVKNRMRESQRREGEPAGKQPATGNRVVQSLPEQESLPSHSRSVFLDNSPTSLVYWEDFDTNYPYTTPTGWVTGNKPAAALWFLTHASWALPSRQLIVADNQANGVVWGRTDLGKPVNEGWFEFDIRMDKDTKEAGSSEQDYILSLKTEKGKDTVIQLGIHKVSAKHQYLFVLQGTSSKNWFNENRSYHVRLAFGNGALSLFVDGEQEIEEVNYSPKPVRQLVIETAAGMYGSDCLFDNLAIWSYTPVKEWRTATGFQDVHSTGPRGKNRQELFDKYRLTEENMRAGIFNQVGFQLYRQNNLQEALQLFLCTIEQDNDYGRGYYNIACMLSLLGDKSVSFTPAPAMDLEQALLYLECAYRHNPEFVLRAEKDPDLDIVKKSKTFLSLSEKYYYSFNSSDPEIFAEGFARNVRTHRWQDLLNYFDKSYLSEYYERFYDKKTDLFFCDFFELSALLTFRAKKELSTFLINQIKDCRVVKATPAAITFRLLLETETNPARDITVELRQSMTGRKKKYSFIRYFQPRG